MALRKACTFSFNAKASWWQERRQRIVKFLSHTLLIASQGWGFAVRGACLWPATEEPWEDSSWSSPNKRTGPLLLPCPQAGRAQLKGHSDFRKHHHKDTAMLVSSGGVDECGHVLPSKMKQVETGTHWSHALIGDINITDSVIQLRVLETSCELTANTDSQNQTWTRSRMVWFEHFRPGLTVKPH